MGLIRGPTGRRLGEIVGPADRLAAQAAKEGTTDILQLVDRLEELLDRSARLPLSNRVMLDADACLKIIDQMRISIPHEIKQAQDVLQERDKYAAQAHEEARRIIAQAVEDAAKQADEHKVRKEAESKAAALLKKAQQDSARIRNGADGYAIEALQELSHQLDQIQGVVQNGLAALQARLEQAQAPAEPAPRPAPAPEAAPSKETRASGASS